MKNILSITLLATGLAGNVFVYGQAYREGAVIERPFERPLVQALRTTPLPVIPIPGCLPPACRLFSWGKGKSRFVPTRDLVNGDSVWIMGPDRMPCLVPSLAKTERMPTKKLDMRLIRPMPNGFRDRRSRVQIIR